MRCVPFNSDWSRIEDTRARVVAQCTVFLRKYTKKTCTTPPGRDSDDLHERTPSSTEYFEVDLFVNRDIKHWSSPRAELE
jgi:hypothetical protein